MRKSFQILKEKFEADGYNWSYVRFCNTIPGRFLGLPQTEKNLEFIRKAMTVVMPLFPASGSLRIKGADQQEGSIDLKVFLESKSIKFPSSLWATGITKKTPCFSK